MRFASCLLVAVVAALQPAARMAALQPAVRLVTLQPSARMPWRSGLSRMAAAADPYERMRSLCGEQGYDRGEMIRFFARRPKQFASRYLEVGNAYFRLRRIWDSDATVSERGARLREELALLGPVAVKVGQTLSQRPDLLPEDVCNELKELQTGTAPFPTAVAMDVIAEELGCEGPIAPGLYASTTSQPDAQPLFASLSAEPIASASLGQVLAPAGHQPYARQGSHPRAPRAGVSRRHAEGALAGKLARPQPGRR